MEESVGLFNFLGIINHKSECHHCYYFDMAEAECDVFHGSCRLWGKEIHDSLKEDCDFCMPNTPIKIGYVTCQFCGAENRPEVRKIRDRTWGLVIDVARCPECKRIIDSGVKKAHATDKWRDK